MYCHNINRVEVWMHNISSQILLNESPTTLSKTLVSLDNAYNNKIIRVCIGMVKQKMT